MRGRAALLTIVGALSAAAMPARASAESLSAGSLALDWRAPPGCPDGPAALERIRSLLASSPEAPEPVTATARVAQVPADGAWTLELSTAQGARSFQRSVRAGSCEEATEAGALIIALAIDPDLEPPSSEPPAPAPETPPPATVEAKPPPAVPEPAPKQPVDAGKPRDQPAPQPGSAKGVGWQGAAMAAADVGTLPRPAVGAQVVVALELLPLQLEAVGTLFPAVSETIDVDRGGRISLISGGARGCYVVREGRLGAGACGGFEVGRLQGSGFGGVDESWNGTESSTWLAGGAGVLATFAVSRAIFLRLGMEALAPLTRPQFVLENVGLVHQPEVLVGRLDLGLGLAL